MKPISERRSRHWRLPAGRGHGRHDGGRRSLTACSSTTSTVNARRSHSEDPAVRIQRHDRPDVGLGAHRERLDPGGRAVQGSSSGHRGIRRLRQRPGGVNGRKIYVDSGDDQYAGAPNKQLTQADVQKDFAMVGGFSL